MMAGDQQRRHGIAPRPADGGQRPVDGDAPVAPPARLEPHQAHLAGPDQEARDDAGGEQGADGDPGDRAVDHDDQRRRHHRPDDRGRGGDGGRVGRRIAVPHHRRDEHPAERRDVAERDAGYPGEQDRRADVHLREPARHPAEQHVGERDQPVGDAAAVDDLAGEDEERDGHQDEDVEALEDPLGEHRQERHLAARRQPHDRRDDHRPGHRQPREQQREEGAGEQAERQAHSAFFPCLADHARPRRMARNTNAIPNAAGSAA